MTQSKHSASRSGQSKPNLILGIVDNYDFFEIEPFLATLARTGFDGHLCLFAGPNLSEKTVVKIEAYGAETIRYDADFPYIGAPHPGSPKSLPDPIYIFNYRHFLYFDYLLKNGSQFANVLLTDVKDVFFQSDPFDFPIEQRIHVAMENRDIPIGGCHYTSLWLLAGYDASVLERLRDRELSCAGTTLAPVTLMMRYLELMLEQVAEMKDAYECADQAAHNLLLHEGKLEPSKRLSNFEGPILTVGTEPAYRMDSKHRLINSDGTPIAVVHQYDRHDALTRMVRGLVRPNPLSREAAAFLFRWKKRIGWRIAALKAKLRPGRQAVPAK